MVCLLCYGLCVIATAAGLYFLRKYFEGGQFTKNIRIDGKVVIITGCNTGIGKETALDIAKRGARVYMACRSVSKCEIARKEIIELSGNKNVFTMELDLSSMESVRIFVKEFLNREEALHILINNAGFFGLPRTVTSDGFETVFAANFLGHFLLTNLLTDCLKSSSPSRVIHVTSSLHNIGKIDRNDLQCEKSYFYWKVYGNTKLANVLFSREFAKRMNGTGGVTSYAVDPGAIKTDIGRNIPITQAIISVILFPLYKSVKSGAQTTLMCALDPDLTEVSGRYFADCKTAKESNSAQNDEDASWLWKTSEKLTGLVN